MSNYHVLAERFNTSYLRVCDESRLHAGHREGQAEGASHFRVCVVSDCFIDQPLLQRHKQVNQACQSFFDAGLHALALETLTYKEWDRRRGK